MIMMILKLYNLARHYEVTGFNLSQSSAGLFLNGSFNWLVWSEEVFPEELESLNLNIDSEFVWAHPDNETGRVVLHDMYKITYSYPVNVTLAGQWREETGLNYTLTQYVIRRRQDMNQVTFKAGLVVSELNVPTLLLVSRSYS